MRKHREISRLVEKSALGNKDNFCQGIAEALSVSFPTSPTGHIFDLPEVEKEKRACKPPRKSVRFCLPVAALDKISNCSSPKTPHDRDDADEDIRQAYAEALSGSFPSSLHVTQEVESLRAAKQAPVTVTEPAGLRLLQEKNRAPPTFRRLESVEQEIKGLRKHYEGEIRQMEAKLTYMDTRDRARSTNAAGLAWTKQKTECKLRRSTMHLQTATQLIEVLEGQIGDLKAANASLTEQLQRYLPSSQWDPLMRLTQRQSRESTPVLQKKPGASCKVAHKTPNKLQASHPKTRKKKRPRVSWGRVVRGAFKKKKGTKSKRSKKR